MIPQTLLAAVKDRTIVPFVGSGLSVSVGRGVFPDWKGLINRLADRLVNEGLEADAVSVREHLAAKRFPEAAELAFERLTPSRFGEELGTAFRIASPRDANLSAVEALWRLRPRVVVTTNYDAVLQWPFVPRGNVPNSIARAMPRLVHNDDPSLLQGVISSPVTGDNPLIWHLHGSVERPDTVILTRRQYERLYGVGSDKFSLYAFALDQLRNLVANRPLLFVGFSLEDPFVRAQLEYIFEETSKQNPVSFVLLKKGERDASALLARYHVQVVEFQDFGPPMVRAIGEIADQVWGQSAVSVTVPGTLVGLVDNLRDLLRDIAPEPAIVGRAFNRWRPQAWAPFPLGGDGMALALAGTDKLASAMRQSGGYYPLLEFVRELGAHNAVTGKILAPWLTAAASLLGADAADSANLKAGGFAAPNDGGNGEHYVLMRLEESALDTWRGQAWLFSGTEPWKLFQDEQEWRRGDFPTLVSNLLDRVAALDLAPERTTLAFMVPRALLVEAIDQLEPAVEFLREPPIGATLPVTVRSLERLRFPRNMRRLGTTWQALKSVQASAWTLDDTVPPQTLSGAVWLNVADAGPDLVERLQRHGVMCAVLAAPPASRATDAATDLLNCVLQAAVPAVVWLREPAAADTVVARSQVEHLLGEAKLSLPQRVWLLRQAARTLPDPAHPGQCLVLLWDDADRLPPDQDPNNRAVILRG